MIHWTTYDFQFTDFINVAGVTLLRREKKGTTEKKMDLVWMLLVVENVWNQSALLDAATPEGYLDVNRSL